MADDRLQILKMLEEGKITAEEASQLLEALKAAESVEDNSARAQVVSGTPGKARWMRIEVDERKKGNRVHIKLPLVVIKAALRIGGHFNIGGFNSDDLSPEVMEELEAALLAGEKGMLIDMVEDDGNRVQIFLE